MKKRFFARFAFLLVAWLTLTPAEAGADEAASEDGAKKALRAENYSSVNSLHLAGIIAYAPPIFDMNAYDGGALSVELGFRYFVLDDLGLGPRTRYRFMLQLGVRYSLQGLC